LLADLEQPSLAPPETGDSPHTIYGEPPSVVPDLGFVAPETLAPYADSTLGLDDPADTESDGTPRRNRRMLVASAVVAAVLAAATGWFFLAHSGDPAAATDTAATPSTENLVEGMDCSFTGTSADGTPAPWDCASPITVRLAGSAPTGADSDSPSSEKKRTFGLHPLLAFLDRPEIAAGEALAGMLRAGNAGSNTTADHIAVLDVNPISGLGLE
jgi:hypothetical protein